MKLGSLCLLPLILGWIFPERNCQNNFGQESFDAIVYNSFCVFECPGSPSCSTTCDGVQKKIKVLDKEAGANASIFCQDKNFLILAHNPGVFIIEQRTNGWLSVGAVDNNSNTTIEFNHTTGYYRIWVRRLSFGGNSKPDEVIEVQRIPDVYHPRQVPNVTLGRSLYIDVGRDQGKWKQEIIFTPSPDRACFYEVTCRQNNGYYSETIEIAKSATFKVDFDRLPSGGDFTVSVRALTKALKEGDSSNVEATSVTFNTRSPNPKKFGFLISCLIATSLVVIGTGIGVYMYVRLRRSRPGRENPQVDKYEINSKRLMITQVLGSGAFGLVKLGRLYDDQDHYIDVAVKMLKDDSNEDHVRSFKLEMKLMKSLDKHPNIVSLVGCCTIGPYPRLVLEYCARGDLHSFLRKALVQTMVLVHETEKCTVMNGKLPRRKDVVIQKQSHPKDSGKGSSAFQSSDGYVQVSLAGKYQDTNCDPDIVTMLDMLNFGRQIAIGMEFLSSKKVVHRDLAARNILVCHDRTVRISDFGLSRNIHEQNIYRKTGNDRMPLKWMAIETLTHQVYSTHSDVWSFGILLWEIVTVGGDPYPGIPTIEILKQLQSGYRMEKPEDCSDPLYNVMLSCWRRKPSDRPSFTILHQQLDTLISVNADHEYLNLEDVL